MKRSLLSVITVVFNEVESIERTIKSIISQRNINLEYIVIDGGSTDGTVNIIRKYDSKIDYWVSSADHGIYDAMNKGIDAANGEWIHFMNAGDTFCNKLVVSEVFNKGHDNEIITGFVKIVDSHGVWKGYRHPNGNLSNCNMIVENCIAHQATFVNANVFKIIGNFSLDYDIQSDYDFWIRAKKHNIKFDFINKDIAIFLDNGVSSNRKMGLESIVQKNNILYDNKMISKMKYIINLILESGNFLFKSFVRLLFGKTLSKFISKNNLIKVNKRHKKIVFDLSIKGATLAGVYVFANNMQKEMRKISNIPILVYKNPFNAKSKKGLRRKVSSILRILYMEILVFFPKQNDIVFFPAPEVPFLLILFKRNYIVTIHDLFSWKSPKTTTLTAKWRNKLLPYVAKKSKLVCTVSEFSKRDISSLLDVDLDKILVIPNGLSENFLTSLDNKKHCKSNEGYILHVGSIEPRKNIAFLLEVFLLLKNNNNNNLKLILTGSESWNCHSVFQAIKSHRFSNDIIVKGYVDDDDLPVLYKNAKALVFPSIEEGFGIPVIEALSQGTPVLIHDNTALSEFEGYGATIIKKFDAIKWKQEIEIIINNSIRVSENNIMKVKNNFSWKLSAEVLIQKINSIMK
jgi:glycosyltransferase involved in cell wall biosynthesis